jgi:hypothetical protein
MSKTYCSRPRTRLGHVLVHPTMYGSRDCDQYLEGCCEGDGDTWALDEVLRS